MEGLALNVITTSTTTSVSSSFRNPICTRLRIKRLTFSRAKTNKNRFLVFASQEEPKLDPLDQMELKFGHLLGEDPKLTMAKIMARKANPDATYLEVEESYYKNKGKVTDVKGVPIDWSKDAQYPSQLDGVNLVRPVPKKGFEYKTGDYKPAGPKIKRPSQPAGKAVEGVKHSVPDVILRKPTLVNEPDVEDKPSRLRLKRNLSLSMRNQPVKEGYTDMTLLRKPEPVVINESNSVEEEQKIEVSDLTLPSKLGVKAVETELESPQDEVSGANSVESGITDATENSALDSSFESNENANATASNDGESEDGFLTEKPTRLQPGESSVISSSNDTTEKEIPHPGPVVSNAESSVEAALVGKPKRLDSSAENAYPESVKKPAEFENLQVASDTKGPEDADWARAETLFKTGGRGDGELISCSTRGFVVSFGSLIGFLPYRNLSPKWRFLAVESWLKMKGLDPAQYRKNLGILGNHDAANNSYLLDTSVDNKDFKAGQEVSPDMKLEELLKIYDEEKAKYLSSFVGQKLSLNVHLADRKSGKLLFSVRPKEREESIAKKRSLMSKLKVGDIVKCCITKITYFGIFVEIDGVSALIHQTEVSWDATLDPSVYFKVGQTVEAKVRRLDFLLGRIFLSLKEIMPDPLVDALESVVGKSDLLDARLQAAEADTQWPDVESLIKELQKIEGIHSVSKGRFFLSPGLAPTFQIYMASMFENRYKLLARSGNKVQEIIVETSLDKEELKSTILTCTNRVE